MIKIAYILLTAVVFLSYNFYLNNPTDKEKYSYNTFPDYSSLRDTLYTFEPYFVEVNLATQMGYLHSKDGNVKEFGVSTGTKRILDGVDTKEGIYVIQSKMQKWYSRQFDSTLMLNWMGFNWGIGFHALAGNSYYRHLGKKKSSHGCVRLSREDAKEIYSKINYGTPVFVHSGNNAVVISFADSSDEFKKAEFHELLKILPQRYQTIYKGIYLLEERPKLVIGLGNVGHAGLPIGNSKKIPKRQLIKPYHLYVQPALPAKIRLVEVKKETKDSLIIVKNY